MSKFLDDTGLGTLVEHLKNWVLGQGFTNNEGTITSVQSVSPLCGSGEVGGITIEHEDSGVTAGNYGSSDDIELDIGDDFTSVRMTVDSKGHITDAIEHKITLPKSYLSVEYDESSKTLILS